MKRLTVIFAFLFCVLVFRCTSNIAGTETTNGDGFTITASTNYIEGTAPNGFMVELYSSDFYPHTNKGYKKSTTIDSNMIYKFTNLESGTYNLYCHSVTNDTSVFIQKIHIDELNGTNTDTIDFTTTGSVSGNLIDTNSEPIQNAHVYIIGSPFYTVTNNSGSYTINEIPAGSYKIEFIYEYRDELNNNIEHPVSVSVDITANKVNKVDTVIYK